MGRGAAKENLSLSEMKVAGVAGKLLRREQLSPQCKLNSCIRRTVHIRTWLVGTAMGLGSTREVKRGCGNWREALGKKSGVGKTKTSHLQC